MATEKNSQKFREFAIAFLKEAKEDLEVSKELLNSGRYARSVYSSQQCVEKTIKAILEMEKIFVAEHDLSSFFMKFICNNKKYGEYRGDLEKVLENLDFFEGEWSKTRYPKEKKGKVVTPTEYYDFDKAQKSYDKSNEVFKIIKIILNKKFNIDGHEE